MNVIRPESVNVNEREIRRGDLFEWEADGSAPAKQYAAERVRVRIVGFDQHELDEVPTLIYVVEAPEELTGTGAYRMRADEFLKHVTFIGHGARDA